jgi:hypothetical protein
MKKLTGIILLIFLLSAITSYSQTETDGIVQTKTGLIEVYYFHLTHRCATCNAVESETQKALKELYPGQMESGEVTFQSLNIEEESGELAAERLEVSGQALLIVKGDKKVDITNKGFLYARSQPEKLHSTIKETVDALL